MPPNPSQLFIAAIRYRPGSHSLVQACITDMLGQEAKGGKILCDFLLPEPGAACSAANEEYEKARAPQAEALQAAQQTAQADVLAARIV